MIKYRSNCLHQNLWDKISNQGKLIKVINGGWFKYKGQYKWAYVGTVTAHVSPELRKNRNTVLSTGLRTLFEQHKAMFSVACTHKRRFQSITLENNPMMLLS